MKTTALCLSLLGLLLASPAGARENPQLGQYAKTRARGQNGRFLPVPAADRAIRKPLAGTAWANPSSTGQSEARIAVTPATGKRAGKLEVVIPEHYSGTSYQGSVGQRQLFGTDIRGKTAVVDGTMTINRHSPYSSFGPARYEGRIRPGTTISQNGLKDILRGLFVNPYSVKLSPAK
jgi:hypothetical protein